eukprot:CAMPEP_0196594834 /NCGR_PEP_ID=MMETSP1081-20130531/79407_1 /TAXON_ID=36882 /ORGANISM="Pyramimonas amylifera, Strain CCMP720" /LENGTH=377 /DNA_ID=CAMNT_0041919205 /DNA_START=206 /DNA_END=1339 /DNA_ORIENTATION=-
MTSLKYFRYESPFSRKLVSSKKQNIYSHLVRSVSRQANTIENEGQMKELAEFLKEDLQHLFDDQGIDVSKYDEKVTFEDPLTRYDSIQGYLFNIQFLRRIFEPDFVLHSVKQTGPLELTTRWTMGMKLGWFPLKQWYMPQFLFTGTSIMGVNPETGRFNSHRDTWDSIQDQEYLSQEGVIDLIKQLVQLYKTPDLQTPDFKVMKRLRSFEVRTYEPFIVAEAPMPVSSRGVESTTPGGPSSKSAFQSLAAYIFGQNSKSEKMSMTTPVFTTSSSTEGAPTMQFVVPSNSARVADCPFPLGSEVKLQKDPGGEFAVLKFPGEVTTELAEKKAGELRLLLKNCGYECTPGYRLARYNDPSTPGFFRRNEVFIELLNFEL